MELEIIRGINHGFAKMTDNNTVKKIKGCHNPNMEADEFMFLANYNFDNNIFYKTFKNHDYPVYASVDMFDENGVNIPDNIHKTYETINTIEKEIEKFCKEYPDLVKLNDRNHDTIIRKITIDTLKCAKTMDGNCIEDIIQMVIEGY